MKAKVDNNTKPGDSIIGGILVAMMVIGGPIAVLTIIAAIAASISAGR